MRSELRDQARTYMHDLTEFIEEAEIPRDSIGQPDYFAIKTADWAQYEDFLRQLKPGSETIHEIDIDDRRIAMARLAGSIALGGFGSTDLLKLVEPRPKKVGIDFVGFEHVGFVPQRLMSVWDKPLAQNLLMETRKPDPKSDEHHQWIDVQLNRDGQEVKFAYISLADLFLKQAGSVKARKIHQR